jgi:hypothetical protein
MYYLSFLIVALISAVTGFAVHAYFFNRSGAATLSKEIEALNGILKERTSETRKTREGIGEMSVVVRSLEAKIGSRGEETVPLRDPAPPQDSKRRLPRESSGLVFGKPGNVEAPLPRIPFESASAPAASSSLIEAGTTARGEEEKHAGPVWKKDLDQILSQLDSMQEIKR